MNALQIGLDQGAEEKIQRFECVKLYGHIQSHSPARI